MTSKGDLIIEKPFVYHLRQSNGGIQRLYEFENGFGASVIMSPFSYGGGEGLWEIAVLHNDELCYKSPIMDDVVGYLSDEERDVILTAISLLPKADHGDCGRLWTKGGDINDTQ